MRIACPICKTVIENAPADFPSRPFCSNRCKLVDLGNWLDGVYRVPEPLPDASAPDQNRSENRRGSAEDDWNSGGRGD